MPTPLNSSTLILHTASSLWDNLPTILLGGLLFSLMCAPTFVLLVLGWIAPALITLTFLVAPAWSALMRMQASLLAGKATTVVEMWHAIPKFWRPSFRLGVIGILPFYLLYRLLPLLTEQVVVWAGFAASLLVAAFVYALYLYAFPLTVLYDLPLPVTLRNSAILASRYAGNTMGLLSMGLLFALAVAYISLALLFVLPAIYALFIVNHCRMLVGESENGSSLNDV